MRAYTAHGFRPSCAWYLNDDRALAYARQAPEGGRLSQPVLFINGEYDQICTILGNGQGNPMREACADLTIANLPAGHWVPLERKEDLSDVMQTWLRQKRL